MTLPVHFSEPEQFHPRSTLFVGYRASSEHVHSLENGEIVLSRPTEQNLSSSDYKNCFGIAGKSPTGKKVLAHICPGTLRGNGFSTVFLRNNAQRIGDILGEWKEEGGFTDNDQLGIFGSCVLLGQGRGGAEYYLDAGRILHELLSKHFRGNPQILTMPQMGIQKQHALVSDTGLTLYQNKPKIVFSKQTHFTLEEVRKRLNLITS